MSGRPSGPAPGWGRLVAASMGSPHYPSPVNHEVHEEVEELLPAHLDTSPHGVAEDQAGTCRRPLDGVRPVTQAIREANQLMDVVEIGQGRCDVAFLLRTILSSFHDWPIS